MKSEVKKEANSFVVGLDIYENIFEKINKKCIFS